MTGGSTPFPTFDEAILADLRETVGAARVTGFLCDFERELAGGLEGSDEDRTALATRAHAITGVSGALGFTALSRATTTLEQACARNAGVAQALDAARREAQRAREHLALLLA